MGGYTKTGPDSTTQTGQRVSQEERSSQADKNRAVKIEYGRIKQVFFDKEGTLNEVVIGPDNPNVARDSVFGRKQTQRMQLNHTAEEIAQQFGSELVGRRVRIEYSGVHIHKGTATIVEELNRKTPDAMDLPQAPSAFAGPGGKPGLGDFF